jgi:ribonuclease HII
LDLLAFERPLLERGEVIVGIDEVGRGALAGPLTVGAVVITGPDAPPSGLDDSKLLSAASRRALEGPIVSWASDWSLGSATAQEVDDWGLRLALAVAATRALQALRVVPSHALIDGSVNLLRAPMDVGFEVTAPPALEFCELACTTIVKGDRASATIAASSVLAKVHRDGVMVGMAEDHPQYCWSANKGYGTPAHLEAIRMFGATPQHRRTWRLPGRPSDRGDEDPTLGGALT